MRVLIVGLAVTLMGTTAMAQNSAHLTLTVGGSSTYAPAPGETFRVDVEITMATSNMTAWGMEPLDEADAGYTILASVTGVYCLCCPNYADVFCSENSAGWSCKTADVRQWPAGLVNDLNGGANNYFRPGTVADNLDTGATPGWCMYFDLTAPSTKGVETRIILEDMYVGDMDFVNMDMTYDPLVLVPEPATLLLLALGGPASLRRRRR